MKLFKKKVKEEVEPKPIYQYNYLSEIDYEDYYGENYGESWL